MNNVKFTTGTLTRIDAEYLTLNLFAGDKKVYAATITDTMACTILMKHSNITLLP